MQVKTQKVDSFGVSGWVLAQIGESIRPDFPEQEWVTQSTSGLAIGGILRGVKAVRSFATNPDSVHFSPK
jgi:hypothetical protein